MSEIARMDSLPPAEDRAFIACSLHGFTDRGMALVRVDGKEVEALAWLPLGVAHIGQRLVAMHPDGATGMLVVLGFLQERDAVPCAKADDMALSIDGERVTLGAARKLVLMCGASSITLHSNGEILIRGKHVVSYSSGQNKIKGASVHLN